MLFQFANRRNDDGQDSNAQAEEAAGIRCNFETECHWKWDKTQNDTFQMVTGSNITTVGLLPGPSVDSAGDVKGKYSIMHYFYF